MIKLDLENYKSTVEIREALLPIYNQTEYDFTWLTPIIKFSLDESVILFLSGNEPDIGRFNTLDLNDHLTEVSKLINKCISKRSEIVNIESNALTTAISYIETLNNINLNEKLDYLNLKASFNLSKETDFNNYLDAQKKKNENSKKQIKTRLCLHNQIGNSLNYGERVEFARRVYCENVRNLYERLFAIKRILNYSYKQNTDPLPNFNEIKNSFEELVWWLRNVIREFEFREQNDYVIEKSISLKENDYIGNLGTADNPTFGTYSAFFRTGTAIFQINNVISNYFEEITNDEHIRLIGINVSIKVQNKSIDSDLFIFDDNYPNLDIQNRLLVDKEFNNINSRRSYSSTVKSNLEDDNEKLLYSCEVKPPIIEPELDLDTLFNKTKEDEKKIEDDFIKIINNKGSLIDWKKVKDIKLGNNGQPKIIFYPTQPNTNKVLVPNKMFYGLINPVYKSSINSGKSFVNPVQIKNINPFGEWKLIIKNVSSEKYIRDKDIEPITDIILTLKVAIRKFK